jgi:hypothetical protein
MAKLKSLLKIEGTLDGMTFYKGPDGSYLVKTKSGVSKNRIANDPAFIRTRENGQEFGHVATSGKWFRRAITSLLYDVKDRYKSSRLTQVLAKVKNLDTTSVRGERKVNVGLQLQEGKELLKFFDFNNNARLNSVLKTNYNLDTTTATIQIPDLNPVQHLGVPQGATHVEISAAHLMFNFEDGQGEVVMSNVENLAIDNTITPLTLTFATTPNGTGNEFYFLKVAFFQAVNNTQYPLNNGVYNAVQLIEIV